MPQGRQKLGARADSVRQQSSVACQHSGDLRMLATSDSPGPRGRREQLKPVLLRERSNACENRVVSRGSHGQSTKKSGPLSFLRNCGTGGREPPGPPIALSSVFQEHELIINSTSSLDLQNLALLSTWLRLLLTTVLQVMVKGIRSHCSEPV